MPVERLKQNRDMLMVAGIFGVLATIAEFGERRHDIEHGEQQRLKAIEPRWRRTVEAERDQLIEPWHQHPGTIRTEAQYLG